MNAAELAGGLRTVTHLAAYFQELKQTAGELAERILAQERGYFTPAEDDEVRAVLASYWQARNALFDLVTMFRNDQELTEEQRPVAFLIAFATTWLLIDDVQLFDAWIRLKQLARSGAEANG